MAGADLNGDAGVGVSKKLTIALRTAGVIKPREWILLVIK